jgi:flagellar hook-associated protein 2
MSAITFSGFNQIDFNMILKTVMEQERTPLVALQDRRTALESQKQAFASLATKLAAVDAAAGSLADARAFGGRTAAVSDVAALAVVAGSTTPAGSYDVVINHLARNQVTTTASIWADKDSTIVATGGTLIIGGVAVTVTGETTLQGLADAINSTPDIGVTATIVSASGQYQLVLTGRQTGLANAFTVASNLTGGSGAVFSAANAVDASDADVLVNNVHVTSANNSLDGAVPGTTLTLLKETTAPVTVTVGRDLSSIEQALQSFVTAYNDLVKFFDDQNASAAEGKSASIGRDGVMRSLRAGLREGLNRQFSTSGKLQYLSHVGIRFERTGKLSLDKAAFDNAAVDLAGLQAFVAGSGMTGAFDAVQAIVKEYVGAGGLVPNAQTRLSAEMQRLDTRMVNMEARLAIRQESLQREYAAADMAMSQLNGQMGALSSLGSQYQLF